MIRLRSLFERSRAHPVLGPILLVVLVLLLAMMFLHIAQEGVEAATELGAACVAIATALVLALGQRIRIVAVEPSGGRADRGPPPPRCAHRRTFGWSAPPVALIPLRR